MIKIFNETIPGFLERDNEILWHGTSNISEVYLDKIHPAPFAWFPKEELKKIIYIYNKIGWADIHGGGFAVLDTFSLYDFADDINKNIYLGETFERTKLFASQNFAYVALEFRPLVPPCSNNNVISRYRIVSIKLSDR